MFFSSSEVEVVVGRIMVTTTEVVAGVCLSTVQDQASTIIKIKMEWDTEQEVADGVRMGDEDGG